MKILIFASVFHPRKSGVGDYVLRLSKSLSKKGHEVTVFAYDTEETGKYREKIGKVDVFRVRNKRILGVYFWPNKKHLQKQLKELDKKEFDLVITNTRFFHTSIVGKDYSKNRNIPWTHVEHGSTFVQTTNPIIWSGSRMFDLTLGKKILNSADRIVAISSGVEKFVERLSNNKNVVYIPNGIELKDVPKGKPGKKIKNLVFVGRLISGKGVQDLLKSIVKFKNLKLTIVGDGPNRKELESLTKELNLSKRVKFVGEKKRKDALQYIAKSDLFINPSYSEGLPTTVLEAGLIGTPVIATDVGGTSDVIENKKTGLLIKEKSVEEIEVAIQYMINNEKKRILFSKRLMKQVKSNFDWENIVQKWHKLITGN